MNILFSTENYTVRSFIQSDFIGIRAWVNDKIVTQNLCDSFIFDHFHTEEETRNFLQSTFIDDPKNLKLAIATKMGNDYLGQMNVFKFNQKEKSCYFDIVLIRKNWNKGIAYEVISELIKILFRKYEVEKVIIEIMKDNQPAIRLAKKLGFQLNCESIEKNEYKISIC